MSLLKLFRKAGLKPKIIAATILLIITTSIAGAGFFYSQIKTVLFQNLQEKGKIICENLANSAKYSILTEDKVVLNELVKGVMLSDDVVYCLVLSENGSTLAKEAVVQIPLNPDLRKTATHSQTSRFAVIENSDGQKIYAFCYPVIAKKISVAELVGAETENEPDSLPHLRGLVHVGLSPKNTMARLDSMLNGIVLLTLAIIGCGILFSISFARLIMIPIKQMALAASKVAAGDLSQTVHIDSSDEIGVFAKQFNIMTAALNNRDMQLKESYEQLIASEERYRVFIQNSSESIWCFEPENGQAYPKDCSEDNLINLMLSESIVVECNDAMAKLHNQNRRENVLNRRPEQFLPPTEPENIENLRAFIRNGYQLANIEKTLTDCHGQIQATLSTLLGTKENEKLLRIWVIQRDITEIKKAQLKQADLFEQIKHANQELKDFAYVASHDLKAPLRGIKTLAEWITTDYADKFDDAGREQFRLLTTRVDRMHNLIDGILQYSRVGRIHEKPVAINLNNLLPDIIDMLAPPANIEITTENTLPTITFEETRIRQVFQNLISNAVKYMDKPQGKISIACEDKDAFWQFSVTDNGPGIDEKYHEKIFKIFQTLATKDSYESTGIGLTLVKKIVEMYGGKVWVQSKTGEGCTFLFTTLKEPKQISARYTNFSASHYEDVSTNSGDNNPKVLKLADITANMEIQTENQSG